MGLVIKVFFVGGFLMVFQRVSVGGKEKVGVCPGLFVLRGLGEGLVGVESGCVLDREFQS